MKTFKYLVIAVLFQITLISCSYETDNDNSNKNHASANMVAFSYASITKIPNKQVCMLNNKFMNSDQIAATVDNKIYYGCCEGCVKVLQEDSTTHYIDDPLSGERVDKATAFIIGKPGSKEEVLYFKNETNAREYFAKNFQQSKVLK